MALAVQRIFCEKGSSVTAPIERMLWDGSPLQGRHIILHTEQGLGDATASSSAMLLS